jgi:hypothetical protein
MARLVKASGVEPGRPRNSELEAAEMSAQQPHDQDQPEYPAFAITATAGVVAHRQASQPGWIFCTGR